MDTDYKYVMHNSIMKEQLVNTDIQDLLVSLSSFICLSVVQK